MNIGVHFWSLIYLCFPWSGWDIIWIKWLCCIFITLIFNNHIVQDNARHHDVLKVLLTPPTSWSSYDCPTSLENTKCSLHVFSVCFLHPCEMLCLRRPRVSDCLYK
ncbi:hypothetical protein RchiOBHm_Chr1g0353551 [Rosa chinensis]|uniref:Uncharacterized protein n=1 Tax=Rosa chinensis TaxID=74649 RepID=A0A2P6SGV2_ROSCH|nr:hypothetical protein RchiOBHm_Chr1g0353551 [Rosa chinensis]